MLIYIVEHRCTEADLISMYASGTTKISSGATERTNPKSDALLATIEDEEVSKISKSLEKVTIAHPSFKFVDTESDIRELVSALVDLPNDPPSLYMDLEGTNLSRHGNISILQIFVLPKSKTYLVDVYSLGHKAFVVSNPACKNLKEIIESSDIQKVFFDVRNDSDALYSLFQVCLAGAQDPQLMELATRDFSKRCVDGLTRCIERDASMSISERLDWKHAKDKGRKQFAPEAGGSYEVFNDRPLSEDIVQYCLQDVHILPKLWETYHRKISSRWQQKIDVAVNDRLVLSRSKDFNGKGRHMALAPTGWV